MASAERYALLEGSRQDGEYPRRFHHFAGLSDAGRNLLAQVSAFAYPEKQRLADTCVGDDDPLAVRRCSNKSLVQ
jgi:hypothetical protein